MGTISDAQRTGWKLAASNMSQPAQVALLVNMVGLAMKLTGIKPAESIPQAPGEKFFQCKDQSCQVMPSGVPLTLRKWPTSCRTLGQRGKLMMLWLSMTDSKRKSKQYLRNNRQRLET